MIRLALDTASDRLALALERPGHPPVAEFVDGSRRHASQLLPALDRLLGRVRVTASDIGEVIVADGPGSFTGLRVGATVAKALVAARGVRFWRAPALLARAVAAGAADGALVVGVSDALRGELFAGAWRIWSTGITLELEPIARTPAAMRAALPTPDAVVGSVPGPLRPDLRDWAPQMQLDQPADARALLRLIGRPGGAELVSDAADWEPVYGRPAEAQARWEAAHGRSLPHSTSAHS